MYIHLFSYLGGGGGFPKFPVPGTVFWEGPRKNYNDSCLSASTFGGVRSAPVPPFRETTICIYLDAVDGGNLAPT